MTTDRDHTTSFLAAFYGVDTVYDFRAMHETDRSQSAKLWRGTFAQCEAAMREVNQGAEPWGIHIVINEMDGRGLSVANVAACRAQLLDLDDVDAGQQMGRVLASKIPPHMLVHTSPGKVQIWWKVVPHGDKQLYVDNQRRLIGEYNGDVQFIDAAHTARLPGFYHRKAAPTLVTVEAGPVWCGASYDPWTIGGALLHVPLVGANAADRQGLGHGPWQAPSLDWLEYALGKIDPNSMGRNEWIAITAAVKQAGWSFGQDAVREIWDRWCSRYGRNDPRENHKQWRSIDATSAGWGLVVKRSNIAGDLMASGLPIGSGGQSAAVVTTPAVSGVPMAGQTVPTAAAVQPVAAAVTADLGPFLTPAEQASYFAGCFWVSSLGRIYTPEGLLMDATKFDGTFGGKEFVLDAIGKKTTDSAWKAATRGQVWRIPKVHRIRFLPDRPYGETITDEFGRPGVNTYQQPVYSGVPGDVSPFLDHLQRVLPVARDREILLAFMAQCVQRPGVKVKWSVVIQGVEGLGKTLFQYIMEQALGLSYVHVPSAKELTDGGGKFNGWMRNKLMIIINEIKSDEKRELVEVMKPWITDKRVEMQNKGADQDMADNPTNWLMFTNWKDAVPVSKNGRRYAIMYSALQSAEDLVRLGLTDEYFSRLYNWAETGGLAHIVDYLMRYQIPADLDGRIGCTRAPKTSSTEEAIVESRGWLETLIMEAVARQDQGFRDGWLSSCAISQMVKDRGEKMPGPRAIAAAIGSLGYYKIGLAARIYQQEKMPYKTTLYHVRPDAVAGDYGLEQGYEPVPAAPVVSAQPVGGGGVVVPWPGMVHLPPAE